MPDSIGLLLRRELEEAIEQANLGALDTAVAKRYLIDKALLIDIAVEFGYDRSAIGKHIPSIMEKVERTARRLFPANTS
jgi:hypothetical protein